MDSLVANANPRSVALALFGVVGLLVVAQLTYLLLPEIKEYRQLSSTHQLLERASANNQSLTEQLKRVEQAVADLSHKLHGDMAQLPVKQMESFVIGRLQKVSWNTDVELASVQPGSGGQVQNFRELLFEVKLNARYHDFFEWLQIVNDELGYIVVKNFEIRPSDRELENPRLSLSLTLVSYRIESAYAS